ncbi:hypothetical protein CTEN210_17634 [Chaetoceros tenuissimus]|uniref:Uncharacterized protein n=1 Tax=Chaetoceros tenuissimus TaxID=426638 RepID=A0AAD3HFK1_9STRA|nr:hypothetical protein CTEN210_17634 [Chaetoceros tenuissimus]
MLKDGFLTFGLELNSDKTKFMIHEGGKPRVSISDEGYRYRLSHEGLSHQERSHSKVSCPRCHAQVVRQYLQKHMTTNRCKKASANNDVEPTHESVSAPSVRSPSHFEINFEALRDSVPCPVPECIYTAPTKSLMYAHFANRHFEDTILIREDGPLDQCVSCGIFGKTVHTERHISSKDCVVRSERLRKHQVLKRRAEKVNNASFHIGDAEIQRVALFKYLGRIIAEDDSDEAAIDNQLQRARLKWRRFLHILYARGWIRELRDISIKLLSKLCSCTVRKLGFFLSIIYAALNVSIEELLHILLISIFDNYQMECGNIQIWRKFWRMPVYIRFENIFRDGGILFLDLFWSVQSTYNVCKHIL